MCYYRGVSVPRRRLSDPDVFYGNRDLLPKSFKSFIHNGLRRQRILVATWLPASLPLFTNHPPSTMPVVRTYIPYRKSRRLHPTDVAYDDDLWETFDEALLASSSSACVTVKSERKEESSPAPVVHPDLDAGHIPRPRNAFICFRSEYVKAQKAASARPGSLDQTVLSCGAAGAWRALNDEERQPFVVMALREKEEHAIRYPNYRYAPVGASGAARKSKKPNPAASRRASTATSDSSDFRLRSPISDSRSSRKYETNPPAPRRPVSRRKSISIPVIPRPRAHASPAATVIPGAAKIEANAEVPEHVPAAVDEADKKDEPTIVRSPIRPSSYDRSPTQFGFKADLSPAIIASLSLASPGPSRSPPPSPSTRVPPLSLDDAAAYFPSRPPSPAPAPAVSPAAAAPAFEWDAWIYTPLEMNEDDEPLQFDAPAADFGFFHPWTLDDETARALVALAN
ncbi:putative transcription factor SOX-14 [Mycena venus]|uniref:Putative transcription factor SOX-14 n=1 Tax=Mycena venus TaxID=2733690 RepID=A0A8H6YJ62_9AGAR|nr:putative transcription factor SOX-14 [Mycena venus]